MFQNILFPKKFNYLREPSKNKTTICLTFITNFLLEEAEITSLISDFKIPD